MNGLKNLLIFVAGAAAGSFITWLAVKDKYASQSKEENEAMREYYERKKNYGDSTVINNEETPKSKLDSQDSSRYVKYRKPKVIDYTTCFKETDAKESDIKVPEVPKIKKERVRVIPPGEFCDEEEYEVISLTYYKDKILTDEDGRQIKTYDDIGGIETLDCFGQYEDDCVYVQNDLLKVYYEILLDEEKYVDIVQEKELKKGD